MVDDSSKKNPNGWKQVIFSGLIIVIVSFHVENMDWSSFKLKLHNDLSLGNKPHLSSFYE